jgi:hypothetical protein
VLTEHEPGVNLILLTWNCGEARFLAEGRRRVQVLRAFFDSDEIWKHVALVFTHKGAKSRTQREILAREISRELCDIARTVVDFPTFFVDNVWGDEHDEGEEDAESTLAFEQIDALGRSLPAFPTGSVRRPDPEFARVMLEREAREKETGSTALQRSKQITIPGTRELVRESYWVTTWEVETRDGKRETLEEEGDEDEARQVMRPRISSKKSSGDWARFLQSKCLAARRWRRMSSRGAGRDDGGNRRDCG